MVTLVSVINNISEAGFLYGFYVGFEKRSDSFVCDVRADLPMVSRHASLSGLAIWRFGSLTVKLGIAENHLLYPIVIYF
jgi:hypothetical protein